MVILVMICQTLVYREVTALFSLSKPSEESKVVDHGKKDPWSKTLNWYFFAVTNYFLYGESIIYYFKVTFISPLKHTMNMSFIACRLCGRPAAPFCHEPSYDQFRAVHHRFHGFRHVIEEGIFEATIWPVLLGSHDIASYRRLKVRL